MKLRNFLIGLLVVLMAFVFISCEDELEEVQPQPAAKDTIAKITVDKGIKESVWGNEKIQLQWDLGADSEGIKDGDVLLLQFRTNRAPYQFDLRTNKKGTFLRDSEDTADKKQDVRWVYQESEESLDSLTLGSDGWYTLKYTFGEDAKQGTPDYDTYRYTNLGVQFKCYLMEGDVFEVKNVTLNGKALPLSEDINIGKHCSIEIGTDHEWTMPKTYVVVYALDGEWDGDDGTEAEVVAAGAAPKGLPAENGYTITYTDEDDELVVLSELSIEEDTVINYTKVGDPRAVTFKVGEETFLSSSVENGKYASKPATDPTKEGGYQFVAWCSDSGLETEFNFAETAITADTTLYAKFVKTWTVSFNLNGEDGTAPDAQVIVEGEKATKPATDPKASGLRFKNWKLNDEVFDFTTATITGDIELMAEWEIAPTVTFTYNYNYEGAPAAEEVPTFIGEPATSTKVADPTRNDYYEFVGWFDAATDGTEYTFTDDVEEGDDGLILYAHWAKFAYKLTATQANTPKLVGQEGDDFYDLDKFAITFANEVLATAGKTLSFKYKYVSANDNVFNYFSVRGAKKWFSEKSYNADNYPQSLSSLEAIEGHDGWFYGTYVFPDEDPGTPGKTKQFDGTNLSTGTKDVCTYPGWFKLDIRAAGGVLYLGDIIYITDIKLDDQYLDINTSHSEFVKYANPTMVKEQIDL